MVEVVQYVTRGKTITGQFPRTNISFGLFAVALDEQDPIQWLDDFFEECGKTLGGCGIKYLAVYSYACEVSTGSIHNGSTEIHASLC